jgi:antitoxin YefM
MTLFEEAVYAVYDLRPAFPLPYGFLYRSRKRGVMTRTIPVSEARQTLPILVNRIGKVMDRIIITRKGKPAAVLMGVEEYESWIETLELVSRKETMAGICTGLTDLKKGRTQPFEKVFGEPLHGTRKQR